ncbi:hypothetical protein [Paracoccus xiamenensis]|uniref:hypothetical protein n=1 Tax=Paracoccus xiamenensis TaxID=2714901 RepID=UPI0014075C3B|nr:hypothetical protein [Paracoccus xiamenensis]NHF74025.1 hypothetical protein [Paracoccus xiamenensis]
MSTASNLESQDTSATAPNTKNKLAKSLQRGTTHFGRPGAARFRTRHILVALSFVLWVVGPVAVTASYLWGVAADKYASYAGFLVRSEQSTVGMPTEGIGGILSMVQGDGQETNILYKFIQSRSLVDRVNERVNLRELWSKQPQDWVFSYNDGPTPEDLVRYWNQNVKLFYDQGMLDMRVTAFDPVDAQLIAQTIIDESQRVINQLNAVARRDTLRYAEEDLNNSLQRLKEARAAVQTFRSQNNIVDPTAFVGGQEGVLTSLQQQLADAMVQAGMLKANAQSGDPRIAQAELRVEIINQQIDEERAKIGDESSSTDSSSTANIVSRYEILEVDRQYAESAYAVAKSAYDLARAQSDRQTLYLAQYVTPTIAVEPEYPERAKLLGLVTGFLLLTWLIGVMTYYSIRDRR